MGTPAPSIAAGGKRFVKAERARDSAPRALHSRTSGKASGLLFVALAAVLIAASVYALGPKTARFITEISHIVATSEPASLRAAETRTAKDADRIVDDVTKDSGLPSSLVGLVALIIIAASAFLFRPTSPAKKPMLTRR